MDPMFQKCAKRMIVVISKNLDSEINVSQLVIINKQFSFIFNLILEIDKSIDRFNAKEYKAY